MINNQITIPSFIAQLIVVAPIISLFCIIVDRVVRHKVDETFVNRCLIVSQVVSIMAGVFTTIAVIFGRATIAVCDLQLISLSTRALSLSLRIDSLSACFVLMTCILGGVVGLFASRYLHREPGYFRFFILYHIFLIGVHTIFQGAGLPTIYIGWELIGLTSALLISFFAFRKQTVVNSLRAFWAYRITDSGILLATLLAMHENIEQFTPQEVSAPLLISLACLLSAVGKSAQFPFGSWLPRAMEGPTPSSAIFYGGLSVHAGMYLMLRISEVYGLPPSVSTIMFMIGIITAWYGVVVGRIQSDAKSVLAYAAMVQVGLMFIEVAAGLNSLAIFHFVSHAMLRTYQLLNAASLIQDRYAFEHVLGHDQVKFQPIRNQRASAQYAYAFWESTGGVFGRLSLLVLVEFIARLVRAFEEWLSSWIAISLRRALIYYVYPARIRAVNQHSAADKKREP